MSLVIILSELVLVLLWWLVALAPGLFLFLSYFPTALPTPAFRPPPQSSVWGQLYFSHLPFPSPHLFFLSPFLLPSWEAASSSC